MSLFTPKNPEYPLKTCPGGLLTPLTPHWHHIFGDVPHFQEGINYCSVPRHFVIGNNSCQNKELQIRAYKEGCLCWYLGSCDAGGDPLFRWVLCLDLPEPKGEVLMAFRSGLLWAVFAMGNGSSSSPGPSHRPYWRPQGLGRGPTLHALVGLDAVGSLQLHLPSPRSALDLPSKAK